jgi:hypothetical protein
MIAHGVWTDGMPKQAAFPVGRCAFGFQADVGPLAELLFVDPLLMVALVGRGI